MTEAPTESDAELASRAQAGDRDAFNQLIVRYKRPLHGFIRRYIGNDDDAYDLLQDTFISAWVSLHRYDPQKSLPTWLRAIALNKCRDFGRRQAVRRHFLRFVAPHEIKLATEHDVDSDAEREAVEARRLQRLDLAIAALHPFYKEPLLLTTVGGLSQKDAATELNTTTKAVEMRIRRAKIKLADALSDLKGEG